MGFIDAFDHVIGFVHRNRQPMDICKTAKERRLMLPQADGTYREERFDLPRQQAHLFVDIGSFEDYLCKGDDWEVWVMANGVTAVHANDPGYTARLPLDPAPAWEELKALQGPATPNKFWQSLATALSGCFDPKLELIAATLQSEITSKTSAKIAPAGFTEEGGRSTKVVLTYQDGENGAGKPRAIPVEWVYKGPVHECVPNILVEAPCRLLINVGSDGVSMQLHTDVRKHEAAARCRIAECIEQTGAPVYLGEPGYKA
jgi:hypothetical protein